LPSIPRAATPHAWRGRRWCASRAPPNDADQTRGAHGPTVANGVGDAGHCVNARSTVAPGFACTCAQGRTNWGTSSSCRSSARPGTLAAARVPRGWSAEANRPANRPAIPPRAVGLFGRALSRLTGMAHWARGPKARALGGVAERTCAAIRGASVLVNSQQSPLLFLCRCPLP